MGAIELFKNLSFLFLKTDISFELEKIVKFNGK